MREKIISMFRKSSDDTRLLMYLIVVLFLIWVCFDSLKFTWVDDTIQKVVLAPLGEEPFKLLIAFGLCIDVYIFLWVSRIKRTSFVYLFDKGFIIAGMLSGLLFGFIEGPLVNIISHFSMTSISSILLVMLFMGIREKPWRKPFKVLVLLLSLPISMFFHSIHNQYANIGYVVNHPQFDPLVMVGRFLQEHTMLSSLGLFVVFEFVVAVLFFCLWSIYIFKLMRKRGSV